MTLNPGLYTAVLRDANGQTGIALVEIYELDPTVDSQLANTSTRGLVQTGDNVMIGIWPPVLLSEEEATSMVSRKTTFPMLRSYPSG